MSSFFTLHEALSHPAGSCNEDAFGYALSGDTLDIWIIDGATSVADQEYLGLDISDPAWFAQSLSQAFQTHTAAHKAVPDIIRQNLAAVTAQFRQKTQNLAVPVYAQPLASLLWIRLLPVIQSGQRCVRAHLWSMGDSRVVIESAEGAVITFPDIIRGDVTSPQNLPDPAGIAANYGRSRTGVLLSHIERIRTRRVQQHSLPEIAALGFNPDSVLHARYHDILLPCGFNVLAMSDGFYRLVDEYALYDDNSLIGQASTKGLPGLYDTLRTHEQTQGHAHAIKKCDDATALLFRIG